MQPIEGSICLVPEDLVYFRLEYALDLLFGPEPPPPEWVVTSKRSRVASGFKMMAHQIRALPNAADFWRYLSQNNVKVLVVLRDNILLQYTSDLIVQETRQCTCWEGDVKRARVEVPIGTLKSKLKRIEEEKNFILRRASCYDHYIIRYEEFKDNISVVESAFEWLVGFQHPLVTRLTKQNPDRLADRVTNYEELAAEVVKIGLGDLLDRR